jgi:small-conductance mechanosensitive channel
MADIVEVLSNMVETIINAIPAILAAIIVIVLGYVVGTIVGKAVNYLVERLGLERAFDQTSVGRSFRSSGLDLSNLIGGVVKAFIIILAVILAIEILNVGGTLGAYLIAIADYLPRLLAGILIIIIGAVFADFLSSFIGKMIRPMFPENKGEIADMLKNLLFIGLIAFILLLALDTMLLGGSTIYPLILGFVIIGVGISLTDGLIKSITDDHAEFRGIAGYAKFVLYSIFLIIGTGAIFATFPGVTNIIGNVSWAFAVALGIMLIPVAYGLTKKVSNDLK